MRLIESKVGLLPQPAGLEGVYKQIEAAGRTCYKSEDKITTDSAKEFVERMVKNGHTAMLEHGTVYLYVKETSESSKKDTAACYELYNFYKSNKYSKVIGIGKANLIGHSNEYFITTNYRVIVENMRYEDLRNYLCEPMPQHIKRVSCRFTCDRGVSHELVRHRVFSFAQESTRFCNYSKDKFNNELTFIIPSWLNLNPGEYLLGRDGHGNRFIEGDGYYYDLSDGLSEEPAFIYTLWQAEKGYFTMLDLGWKAQQARQVLPNALKTEVVMTGFLDDWQHFFELRCAKNAHPDMQILANQLKEQFKKTGIL